MKDETRALVSAGAFEAWCRLRNEETGFDFSSRLGQFQEFYGSRIRRNRRSKSALAGMRRLRYVSASRTDDTRNHEVVRS